MADFIEQMFEKWEKSGKIEGFAGVRQKKTLLFAWMGSILSVNGAKVQ